MDTQTPGKKTVEKRITTPDEPDSGKHPYDIPNWDINPAFTFTKNFDKVLSFQLVFSKLSMNKKKQNIFQEFFKDYLQYQETAMPLFSSMINSLGAGYKMSLSDKFALPILNQEVKNLENIIKKEVKNYDKLFSQRYSVIELKEENERSLSNKEILDASEEVGDSVKNAASGIISRVGNYLRRTKNPQFAIFEENPKKLWSERNKNAIEGVIKYSDEAINIFRRII